MKTIIFILAMLPLLLSAQSLERQFLGATGGFGAASNVHLSSSVGETIITTETGTTLILTQGFQQPEDAMVGIEEPEHGFALKAYPNPTPGLVHLEIESDRPVDFHLELYDIQGRYYPISDTELKVNGRLEHTLDMSYIPAGNYLLRLTNPDATLNQNIKILKLD